MDDLSGLCVRRVRTNPCSVTGKEGQGAQKQSGGALAEQAAQHRWHYIFNLGAETDVFTRVSALEFNDYLSSYYFASE